MATLSALSLLVTEEAGGHGFTRPLPMSPIVYGSIGVAVVLLALLFLWFFRRSATEPVDLQGGHGHGDGGATPHTSHEPHGPHAQRVSRRGQH